MHVLERWLRKHFGATPPLGYCLRIEHHQRWLRLHSLPGSKRYAETETEWSELRARSWAAASQVLPDGKPVWLVTGVHGEAPDQVTVPEAPSMKFERVARYEHPLLDMPYVAYGTQITWPHAEFDQLVGAVARDRQRLVWISLEGGEVFAPYDGGIDLLLETPERAQALRRVFPPDWFSQRPDGL